MENNDSPTTTLNASQLRLIWFYLPIVVIVVQGYIIYQLAIKLSEVQEKRIVEHQERLKDKKDDEAIWRNAFFKLNNIIESNAIQNSAERDIIQPR